MHDNCLQSFLQNIPVVVRLGCQIIYSKYILSAMYGTNFKPKIFIDITIPDKSFIVHILEREHTFLKDPFS
jgi:hypothetical protein